jgi:hypothetical protein
MTTKPGEVRRYKVEGATLINVLDNPAPFFDAETAIVVLASDHDAAMAAKDAEIARLSGWREDAIIQCARRGCALMQKRLKEADAERIAALEKALQGCLAMMEDCDCIYSCESDPRQCPCKMARAALAKSGG